MNDLTKIERVLIEGDLKPLSTEERASYYFNVCKSLGLNPLTKPLGYITLSGRLTLYALKDCAEQLRKLHGVSVEITSRSLVEDIYCVTARAKIGDRTDESMGSVSLGHLKGDPKANAMMKAETKAKRRVTLSICGLGFLDETEVEDIPADEKTLNNRAPVIKATMEAPRLEATKVVTQVVGPVNQVSEHLTNAPKVTEEKLEMPEMPPLKIKDKTSTTTFFNITEKQTYKVKSLLKKTGLPQDLADEWLMQRFGVTKVEELSKFKASDAINLLTQMTEQPKNPVPVKPPFAGPDEDFLREIQDL